MKVILIIIACLLFCMSDSLVAMSLGVAAFFAITLLPDTKSQQYEDHPL